MSSKKNLVIVESPAKAKTIEKYLGKEYLVKSSFGHIRDLPKKGLSIDKEHNFEPNYEIPEDKIKVVNDLKKLAKASEVIWLASDEDREGEAIAWHLSQALKLKTNQTNRIVFHEITEPAIKAAIANPRGINTDLVNAQQARRVLDRLVGYELSPILWKKVQPKLSAGRVQSVAVRLIVEREREIDNFKPVIDFKIKATLKVKNERFEANLNKQLKNENEAKSLLESLKTAQLSVANIGNKPSERNPSAPFTTSTLQQEAARKLGFSVKQTMTLAQRLYENGHITYMRTDSTNISGLALNAASKYIVDNYGVKYRQTRQFKIKNSSAQEAHEAIRPTNFSTLNAGENPGQQKLYGLIWRRLIASQMTAAKIDRSEIDISISNQEYQFVAKGEVLIFDGFLKVYGGGKEDAILPKVVLGDSPVVDKVCANQSYSRPPARFSEASLVKALEELGIGRPSTYAPTISTIQSRGYTEKADLEGSERIAIQYCLKNKTISRSEELERFGSDKAKLIPTHLGNVTTDFLVKYFNEIIDTGFTAIVEKQLDEIAEAKSVWQDVISSFYAKFHPLTESANSASRQETSQARLLGKDPNSGESIYARFGKYGPMLQRGEVENKEKKPDFAPMPSGVKIEDISFDQALEMFGLPKNVGRTDDGQDITANIGRFGPYIQIGKLFVSIKPLDPFSITEEEAKEYYKKKLELVAKRNIKNFTDSKLQILKGPYGPYVTDGSKNARIPKTIKPETITLEVAKELLNKSKAKSKKIVKKHK